MEPTADINELAERIRRAALRHGGGTAPAEAEEDWSGGGLPPVPGKLPAPPAPVLGAGTPALPGGSFPLEALLDMVARARTKTSVPGSVPALLRPLWRNQGGFNGILLEAIERLIETNRRLRGQHEELQERLLALHGWMNAAAQTQARQREWTRAADARLRFVPDGRIAALEERLRRLEERVEGAGGNAGPTP